MAGVLESLFSPFARRHHPMMRRPAAATADSVTPSAFSAVSLDFHAQTPESRPTSDLSALLCAVTLDDHAQLPEACLPSAASATELANFVPIPHCRYFWWWGCHHSPNDHLTVILSGKCFSRHFLSTMARPSFNTCPKPELPQSAAS